ncbi:MAG TPA: galactokinase family protein [Gemmatimonadales bacterium]|nr:galactokinase family protein [Gemmatimonadales bacterium]
MPRHGRRMEDQAPERYRVRAIVASFNNQFEEEPDVVVRAPGRNTAIGDHLDYPALPQNGTATSHTIAWASQQNVLLAAKRRPDQGLKLVSINHDQRFTISLDDLDGLAQEASQSNLPDIYGQDPYPWALHVLALLFSAKHGRRGVRTGMPLHGAELVIDGNIPIGAGQSSSAAFLVAVTLACNELFGWGIPRSDVFTLADIARSGEHEDYSPFIRAGRSGYLDQITILTAMEGKAVVIDHGNYRDVRLIDLDQVEERGYRNVVIQPGLSRSLGETECGTRVEELSRVPRALNGILSRRRSSWVPKDHIHQFTLDEWREAADALEADDPTLARRARYVFEEKERTARFLQALADGGVARLVELVNASGEAMSMSGPYQVSGYNQVPKGERRIAALDLLREIVLRRAGAGAAARMIGGGGAGPLYLLLPDETLRNPAFVKGVIEDWRRRTGLTASVTRDRPARGAEVLWRRPVPRIIKGNGARRVETYADIEGNTVYSLVDERAGITAEVVPARGTIRALRANIGGSMKAILFNPEIKPAENGAAPYLGPWINRVEDARAVYRGQRVNLMNVRGVRDDGRGHTLQGLMTHGWHVDEDQIRVDEEGIQVVSCIHSADYSDDPEVQRRFGPTRTVLTHRLEGRRVYVNSAITHLETGHDALHRVPVLAGVQPWFLLDRLKHFHVEVTIPAHRHRLHRLGMIPLSFMPALPIRRNSKHDFRKGRTLGNETYDDTYSRLTTNGDHPHPVVTLKDWFRDLHLSVGVVRGYDELTMYRPAGMNTVCLQPQISAPLAAQVPSIARGETFETSMYVEAMALSRLGVPCRFAAADPPEARRVNDRHFPVLLTGGMGTSPLAHPEKTATHKDAFRVCFGGKWHIYGTGHETKDPTNPPPGHRPHRGSVLFHLVSDHQAGPYVELDPPLLLGKFPPGIYEAPTLVAEGETLHMFAQTTYYRLAGTIEHFVSNDGHHFTWRNTALRSIAGGPQAGVYDADAAWLPIGGRTRPVLTYSGFSRDGGRDDRPDPCVFMAVSDNGWDGPFVHGRAPLLADADVPWHNSHDPANPFYEWGLEGGQIMAMPNGTYLLLAVAFEQRPGRDYMPAQRLLFAIYDRNFRLIEVSNPILPRSPAWDEYGHGSMMIDVNDPRRLRLLFQARPANEDQAFRDSNSWRLFEAVFDVSHFSPGI